jgi:hypothetical protein
MRGLIAVCFGSPLRWLVPASAAIFSASLLLPSSIGLIVLCGSASATARLEQLRLWADAGLLDPWRLVADWVLMTAAMMLPLTSAACARVAHAAVPRLRTWAVLLHLAAYVLAWLVPGLVLVPLGLAAEASGIPGLAAAGLAAALVWSATPLAQSARNEMHRSFGIRGFGGVALLDSMRSGAAQAVPCVVSCWPWMIVPFLFGEIHRPVMVIAAAYLFLDRMEPPSKPRWRLPPALGVLVRALHSPPRLGRA